MASDIFTACYTAIMATAAVADAQYKEARRRELDYKIDQERRNLALLAGRLDENELLGVLGPHPSEMEAEMAFRQRSTWATLCSYLSMSDGNELLGVLEPRPAEMACRQRSTWDTLYSYFGMSDDNLRRFYAERIKKRIRVKLLVGWERPQKTQPALDFEKVVATRLSKCADLVAEEEADPEIAQREPKCGTHLSRMDNMVNLMVDQLMEQVDQELAAEFPNINRWPSSIDSPQHMIRLLRSDGYPRYGYPDLDPDETARARADLNAANRKVLGKWDVLHRDRSVAKLCYNILVCNTPPGIHNYNMLILGLTQLGEHGLARIVVDTFLYNSLLKPTEATVVCLLHHFSLARDIAGFYSVLRRLCGFDPRGIKIRRSSSPVDELNEFYRYWALEADVVEIGDFMVERGPLGQPVIEAIIHGLIDLRMAKHAAQFFVSCLHEKQPVSADLLDRLLYLCISMLDSGACRVLIQGLIDNVDEATSMLVGPDPVRRDVVRRLNRALSICHAKALRPDEGSSLSTWAKDSGARLKHLTTALWIRDTAYLSWCLDQRIKQSKLTLSRRQLRHLSLDGAVGKLTRLSARRAREQSRIQRLYWMAKVDWIWFKSFEAEQTIAMARRTIADIEAESDDDAVFEQRTDPLPRRFTTVEEREADAVSTCFARSRELDEQLMMLLSWALPYPLMWKVQRTWVKGVSADERILALVDELHEYLADLGDLDMAEGPYEDQWQEPAGMLATFGRVWQRIASTGQ